MSIRDPVILVAVATSLITACAQLPPAQQANYEGNVAYYANRFDEALAKYQSALTLAEQNGDKQYAAIAMFGLARTYAQLCQESDAENWFERSIAAREELPDIDHAYVTQNLLEYGRFLVSKSRYSEAVTLYDRAMPLLHSLGAEWEDPLGYALVLDEYEVLLTSAGRTSDASAAAVKAKVLRDAFARWTPKFKPETYPGCTSEIAR